MKHREFQDILLDWFREHARILPWRTKSTTGAGTMLRDQTIASYFSSKWNRDPYTVLVSELMLQQTQVDRVLPKFEAFIRRWPTVQSLAKARLSEVLIEWQGLGYNRRAKFLYEAAKKIVEIYDGIFPSTERELIELPGIGPYTARAILTFAYGKDVGVIDTNVLRIAARTQYGIESTQLRVKHPLKEIERMVDSLVPKGKGDPWNQALMDFGATVCTAISPKCHSCPIATLCKANKKAVQNGFDTYAAQLASHKSANPNKHVKPFHETDRYFRGRIVDELRNGSLHMQDLRDHIEKNHGLTDRVRFGTMIEKLVLDGLIQIKGSTVSLA
jgi:A/G-specific adenine glycosylase